MKKVKITNKPNETLYIYCRVSTSGQDKDGVSLDVQEERGLKVSKQLGLSPIVIKEQGSGLKPFREVRPLFTQLYDSVEDGFVKNVWIDEDTRLTRYDIDQQLIHLEMKQKSVNLYVGMNENPKKWDFTTDLIDTIITKVNQNQIQKQVRKSIRSKRKLFQEGCYMKGDPPFGYKLVDKKLELHEENSEWVRRIFDWYDLGKSTVFIRQQLFQSGIKPPRSKEEWWGLNTITKVLQNKNYIGLDVCRDIMMVMYNGLDENSKYLENKMTIDLIPEHFSVAAVIRKDKIVIPHHMTEIKAFDELLIFTKPEHAHDAENLFVKR